MSEKQIKKIPPESINLMFAGELIIPKISDKIYAGLFKRFSELFENFANRKKNERQLLYKMFNALALTSFAKKTTDPDLKTKLFTLKNEIFIQIANDKNLRKHFDFCYLTSKHFRVIKRCASCEEKHANPSKDHPPKLFCKDCMVDRNFYNVLCLSFKFQEGYFKIFLSNDLIPKIKDFRIRNKDKISNHKEEGRFNNFQYNVKNLDAVKLDDILKMNKLLTEK